MNTHTVHGRSIAAILVIALLAFSAPVYRFPESALGVPTDMGEITANLRCVTFVNATLGFAAGAGGVILKTTDAGATWTLSREGGTGDAYDIRGISFSDANNGWAVTLGGRAFRTRDGGTTWEDAEDDIGGIAYSGERIYDTHFIDSANGFAVGGANLTQPAVWKRSPSSTDGWNQSSVSPMLLGSYTPAGTSPGEVVYPMDGLGYLYGLDFVPGSTTKAWAVGQDVLRTPYKSVIWSYDANRVGVDWVQQTTTGTLKFYDVAFGTATNGIVVGEAGQIRYTKNAGASWTATSSPSQTGNIWGVDLDPAGRAWAVGASGKVLRSLDGGVSWSLLPQYTGYTLEDVAWVGGSTVVAVGQGGEIIRSTDAGETWSWPTAPARPPAPVMTSLTSSSHPSGVWTSSASLSAAWSATGTNLGYGYVIDSLAGTVPSVQNTTASTLSTALAGSGTYYLHVAAKDVYNRWSAPLHRQLLVDVNAPSVTNDVTSGYVYSATVTLSATDAHSGVNRIEYRVNGGTLQTVSAAQASVGFGVGAHTLSYRAVDNIGNASAWTDVNVSVAPPAPPVMTSLTSSSHPAGSWTATTSVAAAWTANGTDLVGYGWVLDAASGTVPTALNTTGTSLSTTVGGSGTYYLHVAAVDDYVQWSAPLHRQLLVDVSAPTANDDATTGYSGAARVTVTASDAHSGVDRIEYRVDGGSIVEASASQASVDFGVGDFTLTYRAVDKAGNANGWVDVNVSVAKPAPPAMTSLTSSSHASGTWTATTSVAAAWTANGTDLAGYGWVLDSSAGTVPGTQNTTGTSLSTTVAGSGTYYLHVAAIDDYDQWSAPLHRQLLVDVTAPTVDDDAEAGYTGAARVTVTASDAHSGVDRIEYRVDAGSVVEVSASQASVDFGVGDYTLSYRAVDQAGNASAWTDVDVSVAPPAAPVMTSLTSSSHALGTWIPMTSVDAAWTASGTDLAGYGWVLDSSAVTSVTVANAGMSTTLSTTVGGSGTYYLHVAAVDDYAQWSSTWHRQLLVDVTPPTVVDDVTSGYVYSARVTLSASDAHAGVDRIEYRIDSGDVVTVSAAQASVDFGVGDSALSYRAVDKVGNAGGWTDVNVSVAKPAPPVMTSLTSSSHASGTWTATTSVAAAWTANGTDLVGYGWVLDSSAVTPVTVANAGMSTTLSTTVGGSGTYHLHVAAVDDYDQWSSPMHRQLLVDVTKPGIVDDVTSGYVYSARVTLSASDAHSGVDRIEYRIDAGSVVEVSASQAAVDFGVGDYTLSYRAVDKVGNASNWTDVDVSVAKPAPPVMTSLTSSSHVLGSWTATTSISAAWAASGTDLAGYGRILNSSAGTVPDTQNTAASTLATTVAGSGTYYLHVAAVDDYDQWSTPLHRQLLVDVTKPGIVDDVTSGYVQSARVALSATDAHSGVDYIQYRIGSGEVQTVSAALALVDFGVGNATLSYRAVDKADNASPWTDVEVSVAPPAAPQMTGVTSSTHPLGQWVSSASVSAAWSAEGAYINGYGWILDSNAVTLVTAANAGMTKALSTTAPGSGTYFLHVAARDANGQWSVPWHQQVLVDVDKPTASDDALTSTYAGLATVRITANDTHSGVARIEYTIDGGATQSIYNNQALLELTAGDHVLSYRAVDGAGNGSAWVNRSVVVDPIITPVEGTDRYATALEVCDIMFPDGAMPAGPDGHKTVIIASGANWPDALAAAGLAGAHRGPLLLTRPTELPAAVAERVTSLGADRAIIVGGTAAVSDTVRSSLATRLGGAASVSRYAGDTRYLTSNMVAVETVKVAGRPAWDGTALVSTGGNFPDALAAGPIAAANGWPMYLANPGTISPATVTAMKANGVQRVYILGGTAAVSDASRAAIAAAGITVAERWDGADRYATGVRVANESLERGLTAARPALATGLTFPDALAGGVMQGLDGSVLLLTRTDALPTEVSAFISSNISVIAEVRFLGGTAAVSQAVRDQVTGMITP